MGSSKRHPLRSVQTGLSLHPYSYPRHRTLSLEKEGSSR